MAWGAVDFKRLPPSFSLQYYFAPDARVNPFVGAGVNCTWTHDEKTRGPIDGTTVGIENSWGLAAQAGLLFQTGRNGDIVADVRYIDLDAKVALSGAEIGKVDVNPLVCGIGVNFRFRSRPAVDAETKRPGGAIRRGVFAVSCPRSRRVAVRPAGHVEFLRSITSGECRDHSRHRVSGGE